MVCWRFSSRKVEDFQTIGMRCREALITVVHIAHNLIEVSISEDTPKRADFRWGGLVADVVLRGSSHRERRGLLKSSAESSWKFTNWLTHAREAHFNDAEAALASIELTLSRSNHLS